MDQPVSFQWAAVGQSLAGSWKGSAEVYSPPFGAKVKDERNYTIIFFQYAFMTCTRRNSLFLYYNAKLQTMQPSKLGYLKNCFSVIYHEQN